jgi:hypothetical protein
MRRMKWLCVLALLGACDSSDSVSQDLATGGGEDLATGGGADLANPNGGGDLAGVHDLAVANDLAVAHDLAGVDLASPVDLSSPGDLAHVFPDGGHANTRVFIILMENSNWSKWSGSSSAPFVNSLLTTAAHAEMYYNPAGIHPSLPNYLWLEAGDNLGVTADDLPSKFHQSTKDHLVTQLENAGWTWKSYAEDIDGKSCPLTDSGKYVTRHVPALYFDDVTNTNDTTATRCIDHVRPYTELQADLNSGNVADFNFITPNLCDDAHGSNVLMLDFSCVAGVANLIQLGDTWLQSAVPAITTSAAFGNNSVLFIAWDEGDSSTSDGPIGFIAVGANVKPGYAGPVKYDHSSTLRSIEEIFGLTPYLRAAASSNDLSDLFTSFP